MAFPIRNRSTQPGQLTGTRLCLPRQNMKTRATGQLLFRDPRSSRVFQCLYLEVGYWIASYKVCQIYFEESVKLILIYILHSLNVS